MLIQSPIKQLPLVVTQYLFHASATCDHAQLHPKDAIILQFCVALAMWHHGIFVYRQKMFWETLRCICIHCQNFISIEAAVQVLGEGGEGSLSPPLGQGVGKRHVGRVRGCLYTAEIKTLYFDFIFSADNLYTLTSNKFSMVYRVDGNPQLDSLDWSMYLNILKKDSNKDGTTKWYVLIRFWITSQSSNEILISLSGSVW